LPIHKAAASVPQLAEERDRFQPGKRMFNQLPLAVTQSVPGVSGRPVIDGRPASLAI